MCFSATASFTAGAVLLGVGTLTLRSALASRHSHRRRDLPFAAIPLLFAIQQLIEGVVWLTVSAEAPPLSTHRIVVVPETQLSNQPFFFGE